MDVESKKLLTCFGLLFVAAIVLLGPPNPDMKPWPLALLKALVVSGCIAILISKLREK